MKSHPNSKNKPLAMAIKDILPLAFEKIATQPTAEKNIKTGFTDLDNLIGGLQRGSLTVIGARPAMGKTTLIMNIAERIAFKENKPVLVFSLETPKEALTLRMLSSTGKIPHKALRTGNLKEDDQKKLHSALKLIEKDMNLYIGDSQEQTPEQILIQAREAAKSHGGLSLVVVDYLQLMKVPDADNRTNEMAETTRCLKLLAKELNTPVIAASQLNRKCEERLDKRPVMFDLRDSGAIEENADVVMFLYNEGVYSESTPDKDTVEILVRKNRFGKAGEVRLTYLSEYCCFIDFKTSKKLK